jgi:hypothetical protein
MNAFFSNVRPVQVIGPLGEALTIDSLPPPETSRWSARRKAEVVAAVTGGLLSIEAVCDRYDLSLEELMLWQRAVERSGLPGLRVKQIQCPKAIHERQNKFKALTAPAAVADVVITDCGGALFGIPADQQARRALEHQSRSPHPAGAALAPAD